MFSVDQSNISLLFRNSETLIRFLSAISSIRLIECYSFHQFINSSVLCFLSCNRFASQHISTKTIPGLALLTLPIPLHSILTSTLIYRPLLLSPPYPQVKARCFHKLIRRKLCKASNNSGTCFNSL